MSRGKKDKDASLKWWANITEQEQEEISTRYFYSLSGIELSEAEIEIVWRRELKKRENG
jgi:hypothetical protein